MPGRCRHLKASLRARTWLWEVLQQRRKTELVLSSSDPEWCLNIKASVECNTYSTSWVDQALLWKIIVVTCPLPGLQTIVIKAPIVYIFPSSRFSIIWQPTAREGKGFLQSMWNHSTVTFLSCTLKKNSFFYTLLNIYARIKTFGCDWQG